MPHFIAEATHMTHHVTIKENNGLMYAQLFSVWSLNFIHHFGL